jgi:anaerobic selenocysteine-containing dehydrogenase
VRPVREENQFTGIKETLCQTCHERCRIKAEVKNGQLVRVREAGCEKGLYLGELLYNPKRLLHPLKRVGPRGSGEWAQINWDEALDLMASRFSEIRIRYGPEANCVGLGSHHKETAVTATHLAAKILNTPNIFDSNQECSKSGAMAGNITLGESVTWETRIDYEHSRCIILWGANVTHTRPVKSKVIFKAKDKGAKVIVIDPRPTPAARKADLWLKIRPQSDGALALGWLHILINEGLYDKGFVAKHCFGFEKLRDRVQPYSPDRVSEITWIPKEEIIESALVYGRTHPSCIHTRVGVDGQSLNSTQACRAINSLIAIKGDLDAPGGNLLRTPTSYDPPAYFKGFKNIWWFARRWLRAPELEAKMAGYHEYPLHHLLQKKAFWDYSSHNYLLLKAIESGHVRGLYLSGVNPVVHSADSYKVWKTLRESEFLAAADIFMTPTTELADLVLPAAPWAETDITVNTIQGYGNALVGCPRIVEPAGECWDDRKIVLELGRRMGEDIPWEDIGQWNDYCLETVGMTFEELLSRLGQEIEFPVDFKKYDKPGWKWNTPTGKIELYSTLLEEHGYDPLPGYREDPVSPLSTPDLLKEFPLILIHHRVRYYEHTEHRNCPSLRKRAPEPEIEINPETAEGLGIGDGDWIWLESYHFPGRRVRGKAKLVKELHFNVVSMVMGWWFPELGDPEHGCFESNVNTIISDGPPFEEFHGHSQMRGILCRAGRDDQKGSKLSR